MNLSAQQMARAAFDRALVALDAGLLDIAHAHLSSALALQPDLREARLAQAQLALERARPREALDALDAHDHYHPDARQQPIVRMLRAEALCKAGLTDLAHQAVQELAHDFPDDHRPHRMLAGLALSRGEITACAQALGQVLRLCPYDASARRALAALAGADQPQRSIELLWADPGDAADPAIRLRIARLLRAVSRDREAQELFDELLAERPEDAELWLEAGALADDVGAWAQAVSRLERAVKLGGGRGAEAALACTHMHAGRFAQAGYIWWRLAHRRIADLEAWVGLFVCAVAGGKLRLARRVREVLSVHSSRRERRTFLPRMWQRAAVGLAVLDAAAGRTAHPVREDAPLQRLLTQARQTLEAEARQHPRRADVKYHLAVCAEALGDQAGAAAAVSEALAINAHYAAAARLAARLHHRRRAA